MSEQRQKIQLKLALPGGSGVKPGRAAERDRKADGERRNRKPGNRADDGGDLRSRQSKQSVAEVRANKGAPGVDRMTVDELTEYLGRHDGTARAIA